MNRFEVEGTLEKLSALDRSSTIRVPIDIVGLVHVRDQALFLTSGGSIGGSATLRADESTSLILSSGTFGPSSSSFDTIKVEGAGVVSLNSGAIWNLGQDAEVSLEMTGSQDAVFELNGGTLISDESARVVNNGAMVWYAGRVSLTDGGENTRMGLINTEGANIFNAGEYVAGGASRLIGGKVIVDRGGSFRASEAVTVDSEFRVSNGFVDVVSGTLTLNNLDEATIGTLVSYARIRALLFNNKPSGKVHSVTEFLDEAIVIADSGPRPSAVCEDGFHTDEGFLNEGIIFPGREGAAGYFPVTGDFMQTDTGFIEIELGGNQNLDNVPAEYDQLAVSGSATLAGQLRVRLIGSRALYRARLR